MFRVVGICSQRRGLWLIGAAAGTWGQSGRVRRVPLPLGTSSSDALCQRCVPSPSAFSSLLTSTRWAHAGGAQGASSTGGFEFDPMASVQRDAAVENAKRSFDTVLNALLPPGAPPAAVDKVRKHLQQHPIDTLITHPRVQITHVEDGESGEEVRMTLSPCDVQDALEQALERGMQLVQMGSKDDTAFCRIRHEGKWVAKIIEEDMSAVEEAAVSASASGGTHGRGRSGDKLKAMTEHNFRDVVDAHFIGWKSKKICQDMRKGHPVKLTIRDFQSAESASHKLREMSNAIRVYAEAEGIYHHFTSVVGNDREASIIFSPAAENKSGVVAKVVKHPGEKEWTHMLKRMQDACRKAGRLGTYSRSHALKPRSVGSTLYRVDKYGRRID